MAVLFFVVFALLTSLVQSDDNVAMESGVSYQETYKVRPDAQEYGHQQVEPHDGTHGHFQINVQHQGHTQDQNKYQYVSLPQHIGHTTLAEVHDVEEVQPEHEVHHQEHQTYHHQRPQQTTRVRGKYKSQASQVKHINEKEGHHQAIGFSSYVEHVSDKDEERLIKEGSVGDIKRIVPKSGISFKIYHNEKGNSGQKSLHTSHKYLLINSQGKDEDAPLQDHKEVVTPAPIHQEYSTIKGSQYYENSDNENIHADISTGGTHGLEHHSENVKGTYYTQLEGSTPKSILETGGKVSSDISHHGSKPTSTIEFNKNLNIFAGHKAKSKDGYRKEITKFQYKKPQYLSLKKPIKHVSVTVKPVEAVKYEVDSHSEEKNVFSQHTGTGTTIGGLSSYSSHTTPSPHGFEHTYSAPLTHTTASPHGILESGQGEHQSLLIHSTAAPLIEIGGGKNEHVSFSGHMSSSVKNIGHSFVGAEEAKEIHGGLVSHTTTGPHSLFSSHLSSSLKNTGHSYVGSEEVQGIHGGLISHTTSSPHSFSNHLSNSHENVGHSYASVEGSKGVHEGLKSHTTSGPHASFESEHHHSGISHSTAAPLIQLEEDKNEHSAFLSHSSSQKEVESAGHGLSSYSSYSSHSSSNTGKGLSSYISPTTPYYEDSVHSGHVSYHSTANPLVDFKGIKESFISHTTSQPHVSLELYKQKHKNSIPNSHISFESGKGGYHTVVSHTTSAPHVSYEATKGHLSFPNHATAKPLISFESGKEGYYSHSTVSPHLNIEGLKSHVDSHAHLYTHTTASPIFSIKGTNSAHEGIITHTTAVPHVASIDLSKFNHEAQHLHADIEAAKISQSHFLKHLATNTYLEGSHGEIETGSKGVINHTPVNTYIDAESTKVGQNNFDHQKALEGSTSFDFKNAIGSAEPLTHQVDIKPAHVESLGKQTLTYIVPKIPVVPTPSPVVDNHIHETVLEKQPSKHFGYGELKYPQVIAHPNIIWTTDHIKYGNEVHQPLVKLHLPKDEIKFSKPQTIKVPTSYITQQKVPVVLHHEVPIKYTQEGVKYIVPQNHIKSFPLNVDWSFYKSVAPSIKVNTDLLKPEMIKNLSFGSDTGKKIIPILVKKRKNRSSKDIEGIIYGKTAGNRGPVRPGHRMEKAVQPPVHQQEMNMRHIGRVNNRQNEFSVSASYKVDRRLQTGSD